MARSSTQSNNALSPVNVMEMAWGFQNSRILLTAYELELFTALGDKSATSAEVARSLGTDERATDRLMNALCAIGLLQKEDGRFSNTPLAARFLVRGEPDYAEGVMHIAHLWDTWSTLTDAVRSGTRTIPWPEGEQGKKWIDAFIAAMHWFAGQRAHEIVGLIEMDGVARVLDVGGGSGAYSMAFVAAREGVTARVFDLPAVVPLTEKYVDQEGFSDKVGTVAGDFTTDELGSGYDLVFVSAIVHANSPDENERLIRKCADALNPGGRVVVQDFIMDEDEYHELNRNYTGLCTACGAERDCTEPDAERYDCEECERPTVYGVEQLMLMDRIVI